MRNIFLYLLLLIGLPLSAQSFIKTVNADVFYAKFRSNPDALIIDVRPAFKFEENRIKGAFLAEKESDLKDLVEKEDKNRTILVYCQIGDRSKRAVKVLKELGFTRIYELDLGLVTWLQAGYPIDSQPLDKGN